MIEQDTKDIIFQPQNQKTLIDRKNVFDQPIKNDIKIWKQSKFATGQAHWLCNWLFGRL